LQASLSEGLSEFEEGLHIQRAIGTDEDVPVYSGLWAELLMRAGQAERAMAVLDRAIEEAESVGNMVWLPELSRLRAATRQVHRPDRAASPRDLGQALALADSQGAATLAARARADIDRDRQANSP